LKDIGGLETDRDNRLVVNQTLQTTRDEHIFALGDCCACPQAGSDNGVPPRAQAAHQMADTVFSNLCRAVSGDELVGFKYRDFGSLVSLSHYSTVGSLMGGLIGGKLAIEGRLARLVYVSLYQMHLLAIHGWLRGLAMIVVGHVNAVIRPRLKLH
jgi:NADH dehydrogenase